MSELVPILFLYVLLDTFFDILPSDKERGTAYLKG